MSKYGYLKEFFKNHPNIKIRFVLVCLMKKSEKLKNKIIAVKSKAYFQSDTHINLKSSDVDQILFAMIKSILEKILKYENNGSS